MRESDESTGARGQGSAPVDGTTVGSSAGLAGHNGEQADSRTHEETVVERAEVARAEAPKSRAVTSSTAASRSSQDGTT